MLRKHLPIFCTLITLLVLPRFGCPFYNLIHIPCPCCGVTRAWLAFFSGNMSDAFRYHALFPFLPVFGLLYYLRDAIGTASSRLIDPILYIIAIATFAYHLLRCFGFVVMP